MAVRRCSALVCTQTNQRSVAYAKMGECAVESQTLRGDALVEDVYGVSCHPEV